LIAASVSLDLSILLKTTSNGTEQWRKNFTGDFYGPIVGTKDGGYLILGLKNRSCWLLKTDSEGSQVFDRIYDNSVTESGGVGISSTPDGGFVLLCTTDHENHQLIKIDSDGNPLTRNTFKFRRNYDMEDILVTSDGSLLLLGSSFASSPNWLFSLNGYGQ